MENRNYEEPVEKKLNELESQIANLLERVEALEKHRLIAGETLDKFTESQADIIEFEGKQYRKVEREAREGDVVMYAQIASGWNSGIHANEPYLAYENDRGKLCFRCKRNVETTVYGNQKGFDDIDSVLVYEPIQEKKSPNQLRKEIIEKAKKFVEETTKRQATFTQNKIGNRTYRQFRTKNEFVINAKKRTVVVLVKGVTNGKLFEKGISKCHPQDVFNEHIGKAIALGRALGLDVSEFEQAVQPTEIVIGMKVNINSVFGQRNNETILGFENYGILVNRFCGSRLDGRTWLSKNSVEKIIDDTNAKY